MHLKTNRIAMFALKIEKEIIPLLRKQDGFQDEITFASPIGKKALGLSLWDTAESAEAYSRKTYAGVTKIMATVLEGSPQVETFEVADSTFYEIASAVTA